MNDVKEFVEMSEQSVTDIDEEDEDFVRAKLNKAKEKSKRQAVSAESYGKFNKRRSFKPIIIEKTEAEKEEILALISHGFMFSSLDKKEIDLVIDVINKREVKAGEMIIKYGDDGDNMYIIQSGEADVYLDAEGGGENLLTTLTKNHIFGELALLYNLPRSANVRAKSDISLWSLDRDSFNNIVKKASEKKRERYFTFLNTVPLLDQLDSEQKLKIADVLKPIDFHSGDFVINEGEEGDKFYLIEDGEAVALKVSLSRADFYSILSKCL